MEKALNKYLNYLEVQKNYSIHTINSYKKDIELFSSYLEQESLDYLLVEYSDIRLFFEFLEKKKYSKTSLARIISGIRNFYKYLCRNNYIKANPFSLVSSPKKDLLLPKFLYYNELIELFDIPDMNTPLGIRDRLIIEMLYATGIRVSELTNIKISDIDKKEKLIKVLGKGNKERIVYYNNYVLDILEIYLKSSRPLLIKKSTNYLLINNKGTELTDRGIRNIIDRIIEKSSLETKISPHTLRHTFATHLLNEGADITTVQELLGHSSLKATQIYTHITNEGLRDIYLKTHPRSSKKPK